MLIQVQDKTLVPMSVIIWQIDILAEEFPEQLDGLRILFCPLENLDTLRQHIRENGTSREPTYE